MLGDLPRGKSLTALPWGLHDRFHQCPKRDKNGDNDPGLGTQGFGCLHPTRLHPWVCLQESPWPHPRQHLRAQSARAWLVFFSPRFKPVEKAFCDWLIYFIFFYPGGLRNIPPLLPTPQGAGGRTGGGRTVPPVPQFN